MRVGETCGESLTERIETVKLVDKSRKPCRPKSGITPAGTTVLDIPAIRPG